MSTSLFFRGLELGVYFCMFFFLLFVRLFVFGGGGVLTFEPFKMNTVRRLFPFPSNGNLA